jgi:hypothetical protein
MTKRKEIKLPTVECQRCRHKWTPLGTNGVAKEPKFCPKCHSAYWNEPIPSKVKT